MGKQDVFVKHRCPNQQKGLCKAKLQCPTFYFHFPILLFVLLTIFLDTFKNNLLKSVVFTNINHTIVQCETLPLWPKQFHFVLEQRHVTRG